MPRGLPRQHESCEVKATVEFKMEELQEFLKSHSNLNIKESEDGKRRVVCQLTSHEMPSTLKAVQMYVNGKKYKYACEHKLTLKEQELCTQYLVDKRSGQLYCKLTKRYLNNRPHHIRQHLNGRRFQKALNNVDGKNLSEQNAVEDKQKDDNETEMWIPADSESESEEIEGLGSDFEEEKVVENEQDDDYSFDALDTEETVLENVTETSPKKQGKKTKSKKSGTASSSKETKKRKKSSTEAPRKKKKRT